MELYSRRFFLALFFIAINKTLAYNDVSNTSSECKERLDYLEKQVAKLTNVVKNLEHHQDKRDIEQPVAFTAYIDANAAHIGINQAIPYNRVASNIGGGFNQNTHVFTAPVSGIYLFTFVISEYSEAEMVAKLVVDGQNVVDAITNPVAPGHDQQGVNSAAIQVNKGQAVWVVNYFRNDISIRSDENYRFASFSGVLIKEIII
ncbi:complement C1q tumor necrosis factor-related protein 3-like [Ruditapes philippinarum]|uniref:complement C1q tumor necrosis factor-related protein 3-like n=1 Tax=Ruditapes philippinarum TaxID=129788 RepID=UPI00295BEEA9|nr:complement C1q tumor necrosis factor-related protein 3-like [Ruditapes philippinarum]